MPIGARESSEKLRNLKIVYHIWGLSTTLCTFYGVPHSSKGHFSELSQARRLDGYFFLSALIDHILNRFMCPSALKAFFIYFSFLGEFIKYLEIL